MQTWRKCAKSTYSGPNQELIFFSHQPYNETVFNETTLFEDLLYSQMGTLFKRHRKYLNLTMHYLQEESEKYFKYLVRILVYEQVFMQEKPV